MIDLQDFRATGQKIIAGNEHDGAKMPFAWWTDFPLRFTTEYKVADFEVEVGFFAAAMGLAFPVLSADYAIASDPDMAFTFAFRPHPDASPEALHLCKLQWYVDNLSEIAAFLSTRGVDIQISEDAPNQRVIHFTTPNGMPVEIWSGYGG